MVGGGWICDRVVWWWSDSLQPLLELPGETESQEMEGSAAAAVGFHTHAAVKENTNTTHTLYNKCSLTSSLVRNANISLQQHGWKRSLKMLHQ